MIFSKPLSHLILLAVFLVVGTASSFAASSAPMVSVQPDPSSNPVLSSIAKMGAKIYYIGTHSGLDGWFIVKDKRVQIAYSTPDKQSVVIGAMFDANGTSVTSAQIKTLVDNNKDIAALLTSAAEEQNAINKAGAGPVATPSAPATAATPASSPAATASVPLSPGERLLQELAASSGVTLGSGKPLLYMVMDPNCPHCQATWRALRASVLQNALQIRMIPIGTKDTDNERAAAQFLHAPDSLNVWDKYVGGDKTQLAGTPDPAFVVAVRANHILIDNWNIQVTPYMVYRGKDGKVKIVQGELDKPEKVAVLLADLAP